MSEGQWGIDSEGDYWVSEGLNRICFRQNKAVLVYPADQTGSIRLTTLLPAGTKVTIET